MKPNGVFCYLTRSGFPTFRQLFKSLCLLYKNFNFRFKYPVIIFHEEDYRTIFKTCINLIFRNVEFRVIEFKTPPQFSKITFKDDYTSMGSAYRNMCRFFNTEIFTHLHEYDWYCRLDTDSYFTSPVKFDLFRHMEVSGFDYGYIGEVLEFEGAVKGMGEFMLEYMQKNKIVTPFYDKIFTPEDKYSLRMIYTNFEIMKISITERKEIKDFLNYVDQSGQIFEYRWGDAPLRTFLLAFYLDPEKIVRFWNIDYVHKPFIQEKGVIDCSWVPAEWINDKNWMGKEYVA